MGINSIPQVNGDGRINAEGLKNNNCDQLQKNILKGLGVDEGGKVEYSNTGQSENYVQQKKSDVDLLSGTSKAMGREKTSLEVQEPSAANNRGKVAPQDIQNNHVYKKGAFNDDDQSRGTVMEDVGPLSTNILYGEWKNRETKDFNDWKGCLLAGAFDITADKLRANKKAYIEITNLGRHGQGLTEEDFNLDDETLLRKFLSCDEHLGDENFEYKDGMACAYEPRFDDKPPRIKLLIISDRFCNLAVSGNAYEMGWDPNQREQKPKA